jgi:hypothetical protein
MIRHDDGDPRRGALGRLRRGCGPRDDDVHVEPNQLGRESGESVGPVPIPPALDKDVLALDVPQLPHTLEETLPGASAARAVRRRTSQKAYPIDFRGLLRPSGEWRGEEYRTRASEEPAAIHH